MISNGQLQQEQTAAAKAVVLATVRAFYDDLALIVTRYLLHQRPFIRDGKNMGQQLHLSTKQIRKTLVFLRQEHIVFTEQVTGVVETITATRRYRRQQSATFWYIDWNRAVHSIRLRLQLLKTSMEKSYIKLISESEYVCPGYKLGKCNGLYSEMDVQNFKIDDSGHFLCPECLNNSQFLSILGDLTHSFVLELQDKRDQALEVALLLDRFRYQLQPLSDENHRTQLRPGLYRLLQEAQEITTQLGSAITSYLPSENGADKYVGGDKDDMTTYALELENEFSGFMYFNVEGKLVVLDIERFAGPQALLWAEMKVPDVLRETDLILASRRARLYCVENNAAAAAADTTTAPIPRPMKMACRQTTPYFLKESFRGAKSAQSHSSDDCSELMERTRCLSMDSSGFAAIRDGEYIALPSPFTSQEDTCGFFTEQLQYQKRAIESTNVSSLFLSGSSYNSVAWEDC